MGFFYVVLMCLVYCWFCYCEEFIVGKDIEREDGIVVFKVFVRIFEIVDYIMVYNE